MNPGAPAPAAAPAELPAFGELPTDAGAAQAEVATLKGSATFQRVYLDNMHPQNDLARQRLSSLMAVAHGEQPPAPAPKAPATPDEVFAAAGAPAAEPEIRTALSFAENGLDLPGTAEARDQGFAVATEWVKTLGLPKGEVRQIAERLNECLRKGVPESGPELEQHEQRSLQQLREVWRDAYEPNLAAAKRALDKLGAKDPRAVAFLEESGLYCDPWVIMALANSARRNKWN